MNGLPASNYRERRPAPQLRGLFVCLWAQAIGEGSTAYPQRVLPDGCIDILWIGESPPIIVGPMTGMFIARLAPCSLVIGARLRPGKAMGVLGMPACTVLNQEVPLEVAWGRIDDLTARLAEQQSPQEKLAVLEATLLERMAEAKPGDSLVEAGVAWLAARPGGRVRDLCRSAGVSERQLRRRFGAAVGCGPKTLGRILRLQRALGLNAAPGARLGLAALAAEAGYADQAHMSREFTELAGVSPAALLPSAQSALALSGLFDAAGASTG